MPAWQFALLFIIWLGSGLLCWKRRSIIQLRAQSLTRGARIAFAFLMITGSAGMMLAGLTFLAYQTKDSPLRGAGPSFMVLALIGCVFVMAQCAAAITLFTIVEENVTPTTPPTSTLEEEPHNS